MKPEKLLLELELLLESSGYKLRKERGAFRGAECVVEGDRLVVVNKSKPIEAQLSTIARVLSQIELDNVYIKPAIKKELSFLWDKLSVSPLEPPLDMELE